MKYVTFYEDIMEEMEASYVNIVNDLYSEDMKRWMMSHSKTNDEMLPGKTEIYSDAKFADSSGDRIIMM